MYGVYDVADGQRQVPRRDSGTSDRTHRLRSVDRGGKFLLRVLGAAAVRQRRASVKVLSILVKDDHAYHISNPRTIKTMKEREARPEMPSAMSSQYPITRGDPPIFRIIVQHRRAMAEDAVSRARGGGQDVARLAFRVAERRLVAVERAERPVPPALMR